MGSTCVYISMSINHNHPIPPREASMVPDGRIEVGSREIELTMEYQLPTAAARSGNSH